MEILHHQNFANFNTTTKDIKRSFQRIPLPLSRKLTCSAPTEFLPVCLKTLLIGGADFTGARGGKQSSSIKFLWLGFLGFRWLKVASVTMLGIGRGLFKVSPIVHTDFHLKWARNRSFEDAIKRDLSCFKMAHGLWEVSDEVQILAPRTKHLRHVTKTSVTSLFFRL